MSGRQSPRMIEVQRVTLTEGLRAPARARAWLTDHAESLPDELVDDALLVISELVTNAVRYGRPEVVLGVGPLEDGIRIEVSDGGESMPVVPSAAPEHDRQGGRGLLIVASTAAQWGISPNSPQPGKTIWVDLISHG